MKTAVIIKFAGMIREAKTAVMTFIVLLFAMGRAHDTYAQSHNGSSMHYYVENGDTVYFDTLKASKVYSQLPRQKGKEWRK